MPTIRLITREEAQKTRTPKTPGVRRLRMNEFDGYAQALIDNPSEAAVYEGMDEEPQKFVLSLRGAFKRGGVDVVVRKMRGRNEVRAWMAEPKAKPEAVKSGRGGRRKAS